MKMNNLVLETIIETADKLDIKIPNDVIKKIYLIQEDYQFNNKDRTSAHKEIELVVKDFLG